MTWLVTSRWTPGNSHSVTVGKTGWMAYDKEYVGSHILAVAVGIIEKFLQLFFSSKKSGSTTKMVNVSMPKRSGQR